MTTIETADIQDVLSKIIKTYDTGGKGKKFCPSCKRYCGCRNSVCACGFKFGDEPTKPAQPKDRLDLEAEALASKIGKPSSQHVILIAAGECPIKLHGITMEDIEEWVNLLISHGKTVGLFYAPSAMRKFITEFYNVTSSERQTALDNLKNYLENITV